jgi:hypothetical protein
MGLETKEVEVNLNGSNIKHYESLEYVILKYKSIDNVFRFKRGTKIVVKVEHLLPNSNECVYVKCDGCGKEMKNIKWSNYIKSVKDDGKYYCHKCAMKFYGFKNRVKSRIKNSKSFEQWCIDNNRQDILNRWDYELNDLKPNEISWGTTKKYYFKCPRNLHKSELKNIGSFTHGQEGSMYCVVCNSFAQWGIDNIDENFLEKYWDWKLNGVNPWDISYGNPKKVYIKCQFKEYHGSYPIVCGSFISGDRCPYCASNGKVHPLDSLGTLFPEVLEIWSDKNKKTPYEYAPFSGLEVYWKCFEGKHEDYYRKIQTSNYCEFRCKECVRERDESFLQGKVRIYLNNIGYETRHEKNCSIIAQNPKVKDKRGQMPYDNEIIIGNIHCLIEVHGLQHYKDSSGTFFSIKYDFHKREVFDRYKRIFAKSKGYSYLEIPYWADDKDESYKKLINNKISEINNKIN